MGVEVFAWKENSSHSEASEASAYVDSKKRETEERPRNGWRPRPHVTFDFLSKQHNIECCSTGSLVVQYKPESQIG